LHDGTVAPTAQQILTPTVSQGREMTHSEEVWVPYQPDPPLISMDTTLDQDGLASIGIAWRRDILPAWRFELVDGNGLLDV
jgi:hypothetical protein